MIGYTINRIAEDLSMNRMEVHAIIIQYKLRLRTLYYPQNSSAHPIVFLACSQYKKLMDRYIAEKTQRIKAKMDKITKLRKQRKHKFKI